MRIYRGKIPIIAEEIVDALVRDGDIEVPADMVPEVRLDIEAQLKEYRRLDWEISEQAKDVIAARKLDYSHTQKIKQRLADERGFGVGEKGYDYLLQQLIEVLLHSRNVDEVYAEDNVLRKKMREIMRRHTELDGDLDKEVRAKIKNLQEGTQNWEIEYQRTLNDLKSRRGLD